MKDVIVVEDITKVELDEKVYECPYCSGHFKVDSTFIEQVDAVVYCMYCNGKINID